MIGPSPQRYTVQVLGEQGRVLGALEVQAGKVLWAVCGTQAGVGAFTALLSRPAQLVQVFHQPKEEDSGHGLGYLDGLLLQHAITSDQQER